ncbi:TlpA family protein disulfide reductase [Negadavirga shengliensis]|uniref:TlpA family protein disulfide reductase n=1 Tax=Negadavirga shengliensis TaxID=1389218 RepID=A0ABV9T090_9BACT
MKSSKRLYITILILVCSCTIGQKLKGQELTTVRIGDRIPNVLLPELLNHPKGSAQLHDFLGKPLIIDFWFLGCSSCVKLMPHLDSLQKEYHGKLQILLSTHDEREKVENFFNRSRYVQGIKFTQVINDAVLKKLFPAMIMPHQVWIDKNGIVKAITDGNSATRENIEKFIEGKDFDFVPKIDEELDPFVANAVQPAMLYNYIGNKEKILKYSYLSEFRPEFSGTSTRSIEDPVNHILRFKSMNSHFLMLYNFAYGGGLGILEDTHLKTRFIIETNSTLPRVPELNNYNQYYCYDLICRYDGAEDGISKAISKYMIDDLDKAFNVKSHEEKKLVKCWVLKEYGDSKVYQEPVGEGMGFKANAEELEPGKQLIIENFFVRNLTQLLNYNSEIPFVNKVGNKGKISFIVTWKPNNVKAMSAELRKYGLEIALEDMERDVIVLRDR